MTLIPLPSTALIETDCPELTLLARGKVRDVYEVDEDHLLFVATDRISAFDVIMTNGIPGKGILLTQISCFWFEWLGDRIEHHFVTADVSKMPAQVQAYADQLEGRSMLVKRLSILPVEAIVRGYLAGSGWVSYQKNGTVCDIPLPVGLLECQELPEPLYTPSTKADLGGHDINISPEQASDILGSEYAKVVKDTAVGLYHLARTYAAERGILLADTKFEFGVNGENKVVLGDEILTPDSSRFWPAEGYEAGHDQPSFDKQFVRNYLLSINFDKQTPVTLPEEVIEQTLLKYQEAYAKITGSEDPGAPE